MKIMDTRRSKLRQVMDELDSLGDEIFTVRELGEKYDWVPEKPNRLKKVLGDRRWVYDSIGKRYYFGGVRAIQTYRKIMDGYNEDS